MPLLETKGAASAQGFGLTLQQTAVNYIEDVFSTWLYNGNSSGSSTQTITNGIDLAGKGGLVFAKGRSATSSYPYWIDSARGVGFELASNFTAAQTNQALMSSFNSNGFTLGTNNGSTNLNRSGDTYVSWTFRKQPKFFDVVTYTGNGVSSREVSHSLGSIPGCIIIKRTNQSTNWIVWHRGDGTTNYNALSLNDTSASTASVASGDLPTSTTFKPGALLGSDYLNGNANGGTYVAYLFAHDAGGFGLTGTDNVISCGSFTTDGSGNATISLGYEPQWVMVKGSNAVNDWIMQDTMRGMALTNGRWLYANTSSAEISSSPILVPTATGFASQNGNLNTNTTYIYIAIRRGPMKTPTTGTSVFGANLRSDTTLNGTTVTSPLSNFGDWWWLYNRGTLNDTVSYPGVWERLVGGRALSPQNTNAETGSVLNYGYGQDTVSFTSTWDGSAKDYVQYFFNRAPGFFDVVCYTGTGSITTVTHNLGVAPEFIIIKSRSNGALSWNCYAAPLGNTQSIRLNSDIAAFGSYWNNTSPTATVFTVSAAQQVNENASTYVAYLFATVAGVSKVGSYTGTGALQTVNCGFTGGARFVLIKRTDSTGGWYVYDSQRGISSGNDPYLLVNSSAPEVTGTNYVDTTSVGFQVTAAAPAGLNANGGTYIFLAVA